MGRAEAGAKGKPLLLYSPLKVSFYSSSRKEVDNNRDLWNSEEGDIKSNQKRGKNPKKVNTEGKEDNRIASVRQVVER